MPAVRTSRASFDLQPPLDEAREDEPRERAQRLLTRRSLIAFDLDKTVLHQGHHSELQTFTMSVCQTLIHLAVQRYNISAVTGNDLHQLSSRFMKTLVEELCRHQQLQLLSVMHLFCNCATVYICFSLDSPVLAALLAKQATLAPQQLQEAALEALFHTVDGLLEIRPDFIVPEYLARTCMPSAEARKIAELAQAAADEWWAGMCTADGRALRPEWMRDYYINGTVVEANAALEAAELPARVVSVIDDRRRGLVAQVERNGADEDAVCHCLGAFTRPWEWAASENAGG